MHTKIPSLVQRKLAMMHDLAYTGFDVTSLKLNRNKTFSHMKRLISHRVSGRFLFVLLVLILASMGLGIIASSQRSSTIINSSGNIRIYGVGVYEDRNCNYPISNLDWGTLEPGTVKNITLFVRNEGNNAAILFLATDNWKPLNASSYMDLSWTYDGRSLNPSETAAMTLTLSVSPNIENTDDFSFDVIIGIS